MSPVLHLLLRRSLMSGTAATLATSAVLAVLARAESKSPVQPMNATSHWYWGRAAGDVREVDLPHTALGAMTHYAASLLWAGVFEAARRLRPGRTPLGDALAVSALAAAVDYGLVPKRLTPGWERVLSPASIGVAYVALAATLALCARLRR